MKINIQATVTFYKVIVLSIGLCESKIMNERHFADYVSAAGTYRDYLTNRYPELVRTDLLQLLWRCRS